MLEEIKETLSFCDEVISKGVKMDKSSFHSINDLLKPFMDKYETKKNKLPYHINLLDLFNVNENTHSRILHKLLQQKSPTGEFEILKSFVQYLSTKKEAFKFEVNNPEITVEKNRIDLLIREQNKYALIIENKINYAADQSNQLARYIDKVKNNYGFVDTQIYILYLTPDGTKIPENHTWELDGTSYKEIFKDRFINLSFRNDILHWLKESVMPNCRVKDKFLYSALEQYTDYLDGKFSLRSINNKMNKELQNFIRKELGMKDDSPEENYSIILKKKEELENVINQVTSLKEVIEKECWSKWAEQLKYKYPGRVVKDSDSENYPYIDITFKVKDIIFCATIAKDIKSDNFYYGLSTRDCILHTEIIEWLESLKDEIPDENGDPNWYGIKSGVSFENIYPRFKEFIKFIEKQPNVSPAGTV
ncbi:hypothetical protein Barb7_01524 [Bacteroidales bacterium Barb7]|nr:hypothetical protein Barb7_01524 [Bacteroidales bacterium Barb7]